MSTLKPEKRHEIILNYLKEIKKPTKVFQLRWHEAELLTEKVLTQTPAFWYRKHGWKRQFVEEMCYKAEIEMTYELEHGLDAVFGGGYTGKRWKNTVIADNVDHLWDKLYKNKAISSISKLECLKFDDFLKALAHNNISISTSLARNIFGDIDINQNGYITKTEMQQYLSKLDAIKFDDISAVINNTEMLNIAMTKHVLECILSDEGLKFMESKFIADLRCTFQFDDPQCLSYLNKLMDRDIKWEERVYAMDQMNIGLINGKYDKLLINDDQVRQLLFGFAAQLLDENIKVQSKAIQVVPNILDECFNKVSDIYVVYQHLPEIIDNLFRILDNPKCQISHQSAKFGVDELIDNIVNTQHPVATLQLAKIFSGKCELENAIKAETRSYGLQCLSKIMFGLDSPYLSFDIKEIKAPKLEESKLPSKGDPYREWLDQATSHIPGPSVRNLNRSSNDDSVKKKYRSGGQNTLMLGFGKGSKAYRGSIGDDDDEKGDKKRKKTLVEKTSDEIGEEFIDAVSKGLSAAMMDPNRQNKIHSYKTNDILNQLNPEFSQNLDRESKKRYDEWQAGDMKPWAGKKTTKALPEMKKIDPKLVQMTTKTTIGINKFQVSLPDI